MTEKTNLPATAESTQIAQSPDISAATIWKSFQEMVKDPTIDAAKMQTMYELQKTRIEDQRAEEFNKAKFAAMAEMPTIAKNKIVHGRSGNVMYRYSDFKHLYLTVKPILAAQGLILDFDVDETQTETKVPFLRVAPILRHQNGYVWNGSYMPVPITTPNSTVTLTQASKGAVETGKRTVTISCLGITEEEDHSITGEIPNQAREGTSATPELIEAGQMAATKGPKNYAAWLQSLTNVQKGDLIKEGHHDKLSEAARAIASQAAGA